MASRGRLDASCAKRIVGNAITVLFGTGVYYARPRMCKLCQFDTVFLAEQGFVMTPLSNIVELDRLVTGRGHEQLAVVIVVN